MKNIRNYKFSILFFVVVCSFIYTQLVSANNGNDKINGNDICHPNNGQGNGNDHCVATSTDPGVGTSTLPIDPIIPVINPENYITTIPISTISSFHRNSSRKHCINVVIENTIYNMCPYYNR